MPVTVPTGGAGRGREPGQRLGRPASRRACNANRAREASAPPTPKDRHSVRVPNQNARAANQKRDRVAGPALAAQPKRRTNGARPGPDQPGTPSQAQALRAADSGLARPLAIRNANTGCPPSALPCCHQLSYLRLRAAATAARWSGGGSHVGGSSWHSHRSSPAKGSAAPRHHDQACVRPSTPHVTAPCGLRPRDRPSTSSDRAYLHAGHARALTISQERRRHQESRA